MGHTQTQAGTLSENVLHAGLNTSVRWLIVHVFENLYKCRVKKIHGKVFSTKYKDIDQTCSSCNATYMYNLLFLKNNLKHIYHQDSSTDPTIYTLLTGWVAYSAGPNKVRSGSAVISPNSWVAHRTTHGGKLGRPDHFLVAQIILTKPNYFDKTKFGSNFAVFL